MKPTAADFESVLEQARPSRATVVGFVVEMAPLVSREYAEIVEDLMRMDELMADLPMVAE